LDKQLVQRFLDRTNKHIQRVMVNAQRLDEAFPGRFQGLMSQTQVHDQSKFKEPEQEPYVYVTEMYRCRANKEPFEYPEGMKERADQATLHHVQNNKHHAEFYDPDKANIELGANRDSLTKMSDATAMPELSVVEMVCDWAAMSQEKGTSLREWADNNVNKRWKFTLEQVKLINELVNVFEQVVRTAAADIVKTNKGDVNIGDMVVFTMGPGHNDEAKVTKVDASYKDLKNKGRFEVMDKSKRVLWVYPLQD
jgi:hypothetical protein